MRVTSPGEQSPLEDQRDFLLRSLEDLEREQAAGDVDQHDYEVLKDDYTARAAAVLRAIAAGQGPVAVEVRRPLGRRLAVAAGVLAFAVAAGGLVAHTSGRREAGQFSSGGVRQSVTEKLNEAGRRFSSGDASGAVALYDEVLKDQPTNAEALTYKGWALYTQLGDQEGALSALIAGATAHPEYPDVHAFLAVVFFRSGLVSQAAAELRRLDALDPPADVLQLVQGLRAEIEAAGAAALTTSTTAAP